MKILHLLATGGIGGIEVLCKNIVEKSTIENVIVFLFDEGKIYEQLKKDGFNIISLKECNRNKKSIVKKIEKIIIDEKIDIITVHHGGRSCNQIYLKIKEKFPDLKFVRYLHASYDKYSFGNSHNILKNLLIKETMCKALNNSDLIISISKAVEKSFERNFNIKEKNKVIIYNGIDEKFFSEIEAKKYNNIIRIIYIGRLEKVKGVDKLIKAFLKLNFKKYKINLKIVGDGTQRKKLQKMALKSKNLNNIQFLGLQSDVIKFLDDSDIFVYPSIWEEGFGISVVEAMARKCIPITFKKGGLPEIIENEKNGFIIDEVNIESLKTKIEQCIQLKNKNIIEENAYNTALKFNIKNTIEQLQNEYNKII